MNNTDKGLDFQSRVKGLEEENLQLRSRIEFLELFNDHSNSWEAFRDKDGKLFYLSPIFEKITGYSRSDFISGDRELVDLVHPDDIGEVKLKYQKQFARELILDFHFRLLDKDNNIKYISLSSSPVFNQKNEFTGTRISCIDITKQKQIEEALVASEIKLKTLFNNSFNGIILIDEKGVIVDCNSKIEKMTGLSKAEIINESVWDLQYRLIAEDHKELLSRDFLKMAWSKEVFNLKVNETASGFGEILSISGKAEYIEDLIKPVMIGDKRFYCVFQIYLTEQKLAERLALENEEKFRKIFNISPVSMVLVRAKDLIYIDVNKAFTKLSGYSEEEIIGHTALQLNMIVDSEELEDVKKSLAEGREAFFSYRLRIRSGAIIDIICTVSGISINGVECYFLTHYDISDLREAQQKLQDKINELEVANAELEQYVFTNQELKQFAYTASHQLQEPLRTVTNYMNILEEDYSGVLDHNAIGYLQIVKDATRRMSMLINTLLEFSRLGRDKKLLKTDCGYLIKGVIGDLEYLVKSSDAYIEVGDMPELLLYQTEFRQLIQNLIINGIKFQKEGNRPVIKIRSERVHDSWKFSVSDNGIGLDPVFSNKIFDLFQRLHPDESEYEGMGVGLAFCKKIVQLHHGEIWVDSVPGGGSVFKFTIPDL